jgi:glycogen synthase
MEHSSLKLLLSLRGTAQQVTIMKVLLVTPEFPPINIGGGGIVYENLAKQLKAEGHSVQVLAGNFSNKKIITSTEDVSDNQLKVSFISLSPFPKSKNFDASSYTFPTLSATLRIMKEVIQSKETVIHLHGFCHPMIDFSAFICMLSRKKYILTCHGIPKSPETLGFVAKHFFKIYISTVERTTVRKASALTTVSNSLMAECKTKNLDNPNSTVIPNGPNEALAKTKPIPIASLEEKYNLKNKNVIFAIGRITAVKGFQFLVDAMQRVVPKLPDTVAIIAGSGPNKATLTNSINEMGLSNNVKLVGWINEESKAALYERSQVVVFPSLYEPFGLVALEALAMHKPIVAFNTEASKEVIRKETGLLVPVGDSQEMANAIFKIVTDTEFRERLVANTTKGEIKGWKEITHQYLRVYEKVMKKENKYQPGKRASQIKGGNFTKS